MIRSIELTTNRYVDPATGVIQLAVRARRTGTHDWTDFVLLPLAGETYEDLEARAESAARAALDEECAIDRHDWRATPNRDIERCARCGLAFVVRR